MYIVIWKYKVRPEDCSIFEKAYGRRGDWTDFFKKSQKFIGTRLFQSTPDNYLLMDSWEDRISYLSFLTDHRVEYDKLCDRYRHLFEEEIRVGEFHEVEEE